MRAKHSYANTKLKSTYTKKYVNKLKHHKIFAIIWLDTERRSILLPTNCYLAKVLVAPVLAIERFTKTW